MSRNLSSRECARPGGCDGPVLLCGPVHWITEAEAGRYFLEYGDMLVANAWCFRCGALYLAWLTAPPSWGPQFSAPRDRYIALSFRSTFNDEPGPGDLP